MGFSHFVLCLSVPKREFIAFSWLSSSALFLLAKIGRDSEILFQSLTFLPNEPPERNPAYVHVSEPHLFCCCCS